MMNSSFAGREVADDLLTSCIEHTHTKYPLLTNQPCIGSDMMVVIALYTHTLDLYCSLFPVLVIQLCYPQPERVPLSLTSSLGAAGRGGRGEERCSLPQAQGKGKVVSCTVITGCHTSPAGKQVDTSSRIQAVAVGRLTCCS